MLNLKGREYVLLLSAVAANTLVYSGARAIAGDRQHLCLATALDEAVPFLPWTIVIYWGVALPFWVFGYVWAVKQDRTEANRFFLAHLLGEWGCFCCFVLLPTTMKRPDVMGNDLFSWLVQLTYVLDHPDNLLPSIHCFVSWLCWIDVRENRKAPLWYQILSFFLASAVCISTLTVKQHVLVDAAAGIALAEASFWTAGRLCPYLTKIAKNTVS